MMKTIGLIGGMSWESTVPYYQVINRTVAERRGGLHSARILLYSVDFAEVEVLQHAGRWLEAGALLANVAARLEAAGADLLVLCTNTMHKVADAIESAVKIPLLHIADPTAQAIRAAGHARVGLLGTRFTMEQDFYKARLAGRHGLEVLVPPSEERDIIHRIIYDELCLGEVREESRREYRRITAGLIGAGAQCVILGCTEISMLLKDGDVAAPLFDTTAIHARSAALAALGESG
jgi:aspartate racemase